MIAHTFPFAGPPLKVLAWVAATAGLVLLPGTALLGQELHVYTKVSSVNVGGERPLSRSLTLFHAGKVYDFVDNEATIYEPTMQRFLLIDGSRMICTEVALDQITHYLKIGRQKTRDYLDELRAEGDPMLTRTIESFEFQLDPNFDEEHHRGSRTFALQSEFCTYRVQYAAPADVKDPGIAEVYLNYCDWAKRLNFVLHPQVALPQGRLILNERLRQEKLLPVSVDLIADIETRHHLRAAHEFHWELDSTDRDHIAHLERLLARGSLRVVPFLEYQRIQHAPARAHK